MARQVKVEEESLSDEESPDSDSLDEEAADHRKHMRFLGCMLLVSCLVSSILISVVVTPFIARAVAQRYIAGVSIMPTSVDLGTINGTNTFYPHIVGRVGLLSPFPATVFPTRAILKASTGGPDSGSEEMVSVGNVALPEIHVHALADIALDLTAEFQVTDQAAFGLAGRHFIGATRTSWFVEANVNVKCWVFGFVPVRINGISLRKPIELQGLGGFSQDVNPVQMERVMDAYGMPGALAITVAVQLQNPSYMAARIASSMQFKVMQRGQMFGSARIEDLHLKPGRVVIPLKFLLSSTSTNEDAIRAFILGYIKAQVQPVTVFGSVDSTSDPFLSAVLQSLNATFNFQPPPTEFIRSVEANIGLGITAHAGIYNPLPQAITMGDLDLAIREQNPYGKQIFRLKTQGSVTNIPGAVLQPQQTSMLNIQLNPFDAKLTDFALIGRLMDAAEAGKLVVGVRGPVTITIQPSFTVTVDYSSDNITAKLTCPFLCR